jgi:aspartate aminotransferase
MPISKTLLADLTNASWIRRMFEQGLVLKQQFGAENVFDFSLGNPDVPPPPALLERLRAMAADETPGGHVYMPNAGYPWVRQKVAAYLEREAGLPYTADDVLMTVGAAGALNVVMKTLLDPGDEVLALTPYFVEYRFYVSNHGGVLREVPTDEGFLPVPEQVAAAITPRTRALIINYPNNPTGRVCPEARLRELTAALEARGRELGTTIYLVSDEPYRHLLYDGLTYPNPARWYPHTLTITSHSKDLSLAGERIGYLAVSPRAESRQQLMAGATFCNRTLGFVNAPALMQKVVAELQGTHVDVGLYQRRRDTLCEALAGIGYRFHRPEGAFYLFPQSPIPDDVAFCQMLVEEKVLATPGVGFKRPGHFRLSYAVPDQVIAGSIPAFRRAFERAVALAAPTP